ncbi:hypothetical protein [Falsiroseomonas sp. E2-1-a20]|uniref:hypothetical protein n=1 Tax=Falsiroseomonas sp. E2-1-a20 TaxID=3239300 RepID=UPI003F392E1E
MKLHSYLTPDGKFDYEKYRAVQEAGNRRKLHAHWVHRETIGFLSNWLREHIDPLRFGLCHGTRRGYEQVWMREQLGIEVIGTEISPTAKDFPHTIQWDFHDTKPEWLESVDFIYSNSYDHSYDPEKCFTAWASCLRVGGVMLLEHTDQNAPKAVTELDPFGAEREELVALLNRIGGAQFGVREVIGTFPFTPAAHLKDLHFIIVEKRQRMDSR